MKSISDLEAKLKEDSGSWETAIFRWATDLARGLAKELLEDVDKHL